jgi:hypothetical protein
MRTTALTVVIFWPFLSDYLNYFMEAKSATAKASSAAARKRGWGACSKCIVFVLVPLLAVIYPALLAVGKSVVSMPKLKVVDRFARVIAAYDCAIRPVVRR